MSIRQQNQRILRQYATAPNLPVVAAKTGQQLAVRQVSVFNSAAGTSEIGIIKRNSFSNLAIRRAEGGPLTDVKALIQAGPITVFQNNNDRLVLGSKSPFGHVTLIGSAAGAGGAFTFEYFNGTGWVALSTFATFANIALGINIITFPAPVDWALGGPGADNLSNDRYHINIVSTTAGAASISEAWTGELLSFRRGVNQNSTLEIANVDGERPLILDAEESVVPYYSNPNPLNYVEVEYTDSP